MRALVNPDRTLTESLAWLAVLLFVPTILRASLDMGALGRPFVTYWPALLIASLALDLRYALTYLVVASLLAQRLFGASRGSRK